MKTIERRDRILMILSVRRKVTVRELSRIFQVHRTTILRDLDVLTPVACFYTEDGRNGGIFAEESWHYKPPILTPGMQEALTDILDGQEPDRDAIRCILQAFGTKKR